MTLRRGRIEKSGVRFPNRFHIEESYITKAGKKRLRSVLDAVYRDYKFFTVEVETGPLKGPGPRLQDFAGLEEGL